MKEIRIPDAVPKIHLRQFLRRTGLFTGMAEIGERVRDGEFTIDGKPVTNEMFRFSPDRKKVLWRGKPLEAFSEKLYILLHKPEGYLSTRLTPGDQRLGKRSIFELLEGGELDERAKRTLFAVGRLDEDTSGLLLITNDGKLSIAITHPKRGVEKTYAVVLERPIHPETVKAVEAGVDITLEENGARRRYRTQKSRIHLRTPSTLDIIISEGKKREVRKIFEAVGNKVLTLKRTSIGGLSLQELKLKKGEYRFVEREFIQQRM